MDAIEQRGDVAVADEDLGVLADRIIIKAIENPWTSVASAQTEDCLDRFVQEERVELGGAGLVIGGELS